MRNNPSTETPVIIHLNKKKIVSVLTFCPERCYQKDNTFEKCNSNDKPKLNELNLNFNLIKIICMLDLFCFVSFLFSFIFGDTLTSIRLCKVIFHSSLTVK